MIRVLLVSDSSSRFVEQDKRILEEIGDTRLLVYRGRRDLGRLTAAILEADLVFCWFILGYATTSTVLGHILRRPTIIVAGGWDVLAMPEIEFGAMLFRNRVWKTRLALRLATRVTAVSEATRREVLRWVDREVMVVPNGVDVSYFGPSGVPRLRQVVTVAGISNEPRFRVKGIEFLMRIAGRMPDVPFYLVGRASAGWAERIQAIAPPNVRMLGFLDDASLRELYRKSRVYLQPSAYEAFGLSLAEAMACECYPVVTERGALPEVAGDVGSVVPFGDLDAMVRAVRRGLEVEGCIDASARVRACFSLDRRKHLLHEFADRVLSEASS